MPPPIHVCHVMLSLRPGGLENGVVNVINGLDRREFRSSVCCLQELGEFAARIDDPGVGRHVMGLRPGNDWRLPLRLARLFRRIGADIVHTRNAEAGFYGIVGAKLAGVRTVHSEHGRTFPEKPHRAWLQRKLMSRIDAAFAVSECLRRDLIREIGVSGLQLEVVYNGVDLGRFEDVRDRRREQGRDLVIGSVGRLVEVKNYPLLLRAFAALPQSPPARLMLVGEGPMHDHLKRMAQMLGIANRVEFTGHRDDVAAQLRRMDAFVLPSTSEGLSNTLMEAMASGLAVVASDVGGNPELVAAGDNGLLFPSGDESALVECLRKLLADASFRERIGSAAAASIHRRFSLPGMIHRYESLYRRVAHGEAA